MLFSILFRPILVLALMGFVMACKVGSPPASTNDSFSLEYRVNKGLDCAMVQDCGYLIDVSQTGELTRYADVGTGDLEVSEQHTLSRQQMNDLYQLLEETGFFDFPALLPQENPTAGAGSVTVKYTAWPSGTSKSVSIMKGRSLPEEAHTFMNSLETFFSVLSREEE